MSNRFFMRFNLHNSLCDFPPAVEIFSPMLGESEEALQKILDSFETVQSARVEYLKHNYAKKLDALRGKKVLFLGDSITSDNLGYRISVTKAADLESFDGSVSGGTSTTLLIDSLSKINSKKFDITSIMIGTNDSVSVGREDFNQISLNEYGRNVNQIITWAKNSGSKILLFEIPPIHEKFYKKCFAAQLKFQSNANIKRYNSGLQSISEEQGITLISNEWLLKQDEASLLYEPDGAHLSIKGHDIFAEKWILAASQLF